jgi:Fe-S cluster biogenesis protein NfuA
MGDPKEAAMPSLVRALSEFVAALVRADGGDIWVVTASADDVHLHLTGTCAGCPGSTMTRERLLEPAVRGVLPKATVRVTTGWDVPKGAQKVEPAS